MNNYHIDFLSHPIFQSSSDPYRRAEELVRGKSYFDFMPPSLLPRINKKIVPYDTAAQIHATSMEGVLERDPRTHFSAIVVWALLNGIVWERAFDLFDSQGDEGSWKIFQSICLPEYLIPFVNIVIHNGQKQTLQGIMVDTSKQLDLKADFYRSQGDSLLLDHPHIHYSLLLLRTSAEILSDRIRLGRPVPNIYANLPR